MKTRLTEKEKELVAVGASVAAGCIPCTNYHVKAAGAAGAASDEVERAVDIALGIKTGAAAVMRQVAQMALGLGAHHETETSGAAADIDSADRMTRLVAIAAAVAVNCTTSLRQHLAAAREAGTGEDEIRLVVALAQKIRAKASEKSDDATKATGAAGAASQAPCGCGPSPC